LHEPIRRLRERRRREKNGEINARGEIVDAKRKEQNRVFNRLEKV
jgi:hypothetical protein